MNGFWPTPDWEPWAALTAAGYRVVDDERNTAPPCVLLQVVTATLRSNCITEGEVRATIVLPHADNRDTRKWGWTGPVPVLLPFADETGANESEMAGYPVIQLSLPYTHRS